MFRSVYVLEMIRVAREGIYDTCDKVQRIDICVFRQNRFGHSKVSCKDVNAYRDQEDK